MDAAIMTFGVWAAAVLGAWFGGRQLERAFQFLGSYSAGPRPYPDQDPAPAHAG
jgi:hypothetical protein